MIGLKKNVDASQFSGIGVGGKVAAQVDISDLEGLKEALKIAKESQWRAIVIGDGTNTFFAGGQLPIMLIRNLFNGRSIVSETDTAVVIEIQAGENWNEIVDWTVENGWAGIHTLTAIPGTVGAAPIQNIGAYGHEVAEVINSVHVYDRETETEEWLTNSECQFSYRNSLFKFNSRYVVLGLQLTLSKQAPVFPTYEAVRRYFEERANPNPSLVEIRDAVTAIRWSKLPKPELIPNCGSWFKNPIIEPATADRLKAEHPDLTSWSVSGGTKLAAGWLVERAVGKGFCDHNFCNYDKQALVLINPKHVSDTDKLFAFEELIKTKVREKFGVELEREPILIQ